MCGVVWGNSIDRVDVCKFVYDLVKGSKMADPYLFLVITLLRKKKKK